VPLVGGLKPTYPIGLKKKKKKASAQAQVKIRTTGCLCKQSCLCKKSEYGCFSRNNRVFIFIKIRTKDKNTNTSLLDTVRREWIHLKQTHLNTDSFNLNDIILLQVSLKDKI
jgi:hypothetical protein